MEDCSAPEGDKTVFAIPEIQLTDMRWKAIIPVAAIIILIALFNMLFLDGILKDVLTSNGEAVAGAKVELDELSSSFFGASLELEGLKIADKNEPMTNIVEFRHAAFDGRFAPLLEKKIIIDKAEINGIKFKTARETSGAIEQASIETKEPQEKGKDGGKLPFSLASFDKLDESFDPEKYINPDELRSFKEAEKAKSSINSMSEGINKDIENLRIKEKSNSISSRVDEIVAKLEESRSPKDIKKNLDKLKQLKKEVDQLKSDIEGIKSKISERYDSANNLLQNIDQAKEEDIKHVKSKMEIPAIDSKSIARFLFGDDVANSLERALYWVKMSRKIMPSKGAKKEKLTRGKGRNIEFTKENELPSFLLLRSDLSGEISGIQEPMRFSGTLTGVTSNPPAYGKPTHLEISGNDTGRKLHAKLTIDHVTEQAKEKVFIEYSGFSIKDLAFGDQGSFNLKIKSGSASIKGSLEITGEKLAGSFEFFGEGLSIDPELKQSTGSEIQRKLKDSLLESLSRTKRLSIKIDISGTLSEPGYKITSNIDSVISDSLKNTLGNELSKHDKKINEYLNSLTGGKKEELKVLIERNKNDNLNKLAGYDTIQKLKEKIEEEIKKANMGSLRDNIKGLFDK